ncbi:GAF domain-containing protein [Streptomyces sp. NPDC059970]|uniref:GAF domain-containing protein n=1 Tax=Streptomyces sp. NPDC059970 TaxID=3347019 RepID=UPI0036826E13
MTMPVNQPDTTSAQDIERRAELLYALGLTAPDRELDDLAIRLSRAAGVPYAMVNVFGSEQQFVGLATPMGGELPTVGRSMPLDHGFCPAVVDKKLALVLPSVYVAPRFGVNPVVDLIGIRTYAGAPLIHEGIVLGTVCFVGLQEQPDSAGHTMLALIKAHRDSVMNFIHRRAGYLPR